VAQTECNEDQYSGVVVLAVT